MVNRCADGGLGLPAASVAMTETEWFPNSSAVSGVKFQSPTASALTIFAFASSSSSHSFTVLWGSALPLMMGVWVVMEPLGAATTGASGGTVSTVKLCSSESGLTLPTTSVAMAKIR